MPSTSSNLNGFVVSDETVVQLAQTPELITSFYYSDSLGAFLVLTDAQNLIFLNANTTDLASRQQTLLSLSTRQDGFKYMRKFFFSENYQYLIVLLDNELSYLATQFNEQLFSSSTTFASKIEVYSLTATTLNIANVALILSISEQGQTTSQILPIIDFCASSDESKIAYMINTKIQIYETSIIGNINFRPTLNFINSDAPYSQGFTKFIFSQNLALIMNNQNGISAYRTDTSMWYAGIMTYSNVSFQFIYLSKTYFIFTGTSLQQGSLTPFQLVLQNKPLNKALPSTSSTIFSVQPQQIIISSNFLFAILQSDTAAIYLISEQSQTTTQFDLVLIQTFQIQQNIISMQMSLYTLIILNYKQLSIFSRLDTTIPNQLNYVNLFPYQRIWFTSTTATFNPAQFCAVYNNQVFILASSNLYLSTYASTTSVALPTPATISKFGVLASPYAYYYMQTNLNLTIASGNITSTLKTSINLNANFVSVDQILQTFNNIIFIKGQMVSSSSSSSTPSLSNIQIYSVDNTTLAITQLTVPTNIKKLNCSSIKYSSVTQYVYFTSGNQIYQIQNNTQTTFSAILFFDFSPLILSESYKVNRIFVSSNFAYVTLNYGFIFYECNLSTKSVRSINIPFTTLRIFPFGNLLVLTNASQIAIYEIISNDIILFKSINPNSINQIVCSDSVYSTFSSFSVIQKNAFIQYNFQRYQQSIVLKLTTTSLPIPLGSQLNFEYYVSNVKNQLMKLSFIQQDQGLIQTNVNFGINKIGDVVIQTSDLYLSRIGVNVTNNYPTTTMQNQSTLLLFGFLQRLTTTLQQSSIQALQSIGQITSDGYIVVEGLLTALNTLSLSASETAIITSSIVKIHYPVQVQQSLFLDQSKFLSFTTLSDTVQITMTLNKQLFQFILKTVFIFEVSKSLDWSIINGNCTLVLQGHPDQIKIYIQYFMIQSMQQYVSPQEESLTVVFNDFLNSQQVFTISLNTFLSQNSNLFLQIDGLIIKSKLQTMFNQLYIASNLGSSTVSFSIPSSTFVDTDLNKLSNLLQQNTDIYKEMNLQYIFYQFYHTTDSGIINLVNFNSSQSGMVLLASKSGVVTTPDSFSIDINNFRVQGLFQESREYHRIIVCATNEINQICDEIEFTLSLTSTLDILLVTLLPIGCALFLYWIYCRFYIIKFFYQMDKITFSDEKIYSNNHYHKQIPIVFDQYEIAKELWNIYKAIRIKQIEEKEPERFLLYDDEENMFQIKNDPSIFGKVSSENANTAATANNGSGGPNQQTNVLEINGILKPPSNRKIEGQVNSLPPESKSAKKTKRQLRQIRSMTSQEYVLTNTNNGGITTGRQNSSTNLKVGGGEEHDISKNPTPDNSIMKIPIHQIDAKDCSFSNTTPIHQAQPTSTEVNFNNETFTLQNPGNNNNNHHTLNTEQNSPIERNQSNNFQNRTTSQNQSIKQENIDQLNMSFLNTQMDNESTMTHNPYQSYQEFIYCNKKVQIIQSNNGQSALLKNPQKVEGFGDTSSSCFQYTKFQGPPLSPYQINFLQTVIEQQKFEDERNQSVFNKCFQENNILYNKTNSYIVRDLINNSRIFNQKVFDLWKTTQSSNPIPMNDTVDNTKGFDEIDSPRSNKLAYKRNNPNNKNRFMKKYRLNTQRKNLSTLSLNINNHVEEIKQRFSKLVRDQMSLKNQNNLRMKNLKEECILDEFGSINEDIFLDDLKKTLTQYFKTKIENRINVSKYKFLLNQVQTINYRQEPLSRYLFVELSRHILSIDSISKYVYEYLKNLALLYNNQNDWYKAYLYIIGHDQDNQVFPFPSIIVKDDMIAQGFTDLNIRFVTGKEGHYKEKIKIIGQALTADALDLNKYSNKCGECLQLDPDDSIETIRAINIPENTIGGRMRQLKNFILWMFGDFEKQHLLNNMLLPEWMTCDITYNTVHIKGSPNNSQVGRYLILVSGKRKHILRSFILKVLRSQDSTIPRGKKHIPFDQLSNGNLNDSRAFGIDFNDNPSPYIGSKKDQNDLLHSQSFNKSKLLRKQTSQVYTPNSKEFQPKQPNDQNGFNNKYLPKTKSLFQKSTLPIKLGSIFTNSPRNMHSQNIYQQSSERGIEDRGRAFSDFISSKSSQSKTINQSNIKNHSDSKNAISTGSNNSSFRKDEQILTNKLIPVSEEENMCESSMKSSSISENMTMYHQGPQDYIKEAKLLPISKDVSVTMFDASYNELNGKKSEDSPRVNISN